MFYYLYRITNTINGKVYIGVHQTRALDDGYMGSGKAIRSAVAKYGVENFTKEILEFFTDAESMYERERAVVTDEFILREDVYNLRRGGTGGFDYINKNKTFEDRSAAGKLCHIKHPALATQNLVVTAEGAQKSKNTKVEKYGESYFSEIASLPKTENHRRAISASLTGRKREGSQAVGHKKPRVKCPHCDKEGAPHVMYRHHFDNCKVRFV